MCSDEAVFMGWEEGKGLPKYLKENFSGVDENRNDVNELSSRS